ncbi:MAG: hypothetical protein ABEJ98_05215 [Candidatus Nanohaloarchaea archaeon]
MNVIVKGFLTLVVVVLMVPGLVFEPGPFSELVGAGLIASIWGLDWNPDNGGGKK